MADNIEEKVEPSDAPKQETVNSPDLVTRVSEVKPVVSTPALDRSKHDELIASLPPEVQSQVKAYENEIMSGANKKFMAAADKERELSQPWTTERVAKLLNDQTFVASAQEVAQRQALSQNPSGSGMQDQEWSALTDGERKQFYAVQQNQIQMQGQMNQLLARQEDLNLMSRYKNYEASKIDKLQQDLIQGNVRATREHLHKVLDYDDAIDRAYNMGKQDSQTEIKGKINASSPAVGVNTTQADSIPEKPKGMSNVQHFINLAQSRIKQINQQSGKT